jgi:hypothetical protein
LQNFSENNDKSEENASVQKKALQCSTSLVKSNKSLRDVNHSNSSSALVKEGAEK